MHNSISLWAYCRPYTEVWLSLISVSVTLSGGVCGTTALNKLQKLKNRAARIVANSPYRMSAPPIIKQLGWLTVNDLIETETPKMVYRSINHEAPEYLTGLFQRLTETSARKLHNTSTDLYVPFLKTACGQKCFSYRGAKLWNDLNREHKMANTFTQFKSSLKNDTSWALSYFSFYF